MSTTQLETPSQVVMGGDGNGNDRDRLATLRRQFVVGDDVITRRMVACMEKIVEHCTIYENGNVDLKPHITGPGTRLRRSWRRGPWRQGSTVTGSTRR